MRSKRWLAVVALILLSAVLYGCASEPVGGSNLEPGAGPRGSRYIRGEGYK